MEEVWKDIKGYEGLYQISNLGLVRSLDRYIERRKTGFSGRAGSYYSKGKMVAITDNRNGYKLVSKTLIDARLLFLSFNPMRKACLLFSD